MTPHDDRSHRRARAPAARHPRPPPVVRLLARPEPPLVRGRRLPVAPPPRAVAHVPRRGALLHGRGAPLPRSDRVARAPARDLALSRAGSGARQGARRLQRLGALTGDRRRVGREADPGEPRALAHATAHGPARRHLRARALHGDPRRAHVHERGAPRANGAGDAPPVAVARRRRDRAQGGRVRHVPRRRRHVLDARDRHGAHHGHLPRQRRPLPGSPHQVGR